MLQRAVISGVSYQICKIAGCACAGNAGNVFPHHRFQRKPLVSDPGMRHARAVMHVGIAYPRWRGKRSRHSRRMRIPQFYVSGKSPMESTQYLQATCHFSVRYILYCQDQCIWMLTLSPLTKHPAAADYVWDMDNSSITSMLWIGKEPQHKHYSY